jgi:hypothetical protein
LDDKKRKEKEVPTDDGEDDEERDADAFPVLLTWDNSHQLL